MPFDWSNYLRLADELSKRREEDCLRTAISRSYYYIYHLARQRLQDNNFIITNVDAHKQVWEKYNESADPRCQRLATIGKDLSYKRKKADYDNPYGGDLEREFPALLARAGKFASDLAALDKRLPANQGVRK